MKALRTLSPVIFLFALCASAFAQDVKTDYDRQANFANYHTYYWAKVDVSNSLWEQRLQQAVDQSLQSKGWQRVESNGDVALAAVGSSQNQQEYQSFYNGMGGWGWNGGMGTTTTTVNNYRVGTLVLDMYDAHNKHLLWRSTSSDTLSDKPEKNEDKLDKAVQKMFKNFPPEAKN